MKEEKKLPTPNALWSMLTMKCPRCRRGEMFNSNSSYRKLSLKNIFAMPENCPVCGQKYDMEPGFWYGTSYVSYALTVALSVATFVAWVVLIGVSVKDGDNRIYWWLGINAVVLIVAQPWLMRFSRVLYIRFFVSYDKDFEKTSPTKFE